MHAIARLGFMVLLLASAQASAFGTYRAGSVVLDQNDSVMKIIGAMGQPAYKEPVVNRFGAQVAENWFYQDGSKTVKFTISGGRIVVIEEIRQ
jgi:hypothetical protein